MAHYAELGVDNVVKRVLTCCMIYFVILTFWFASGQNKIDEEFGFSEDD